MWICVSMFLTARTALDHTPRRSNWLMLRCKIRDLHQHQTQPTKKRRYLRRAQRLSVSQSTQAYRLFESRTTKRRQCPYLDLQTAALSLPSRHLIHRPYLRRRRTNVNLLSSHCSNDNQRRCRPYQHSRSTRRLSSHHQQQSRDSAGAIANSSGS